MAAFGGVAAAIAAAAVAVGVPGASADRHPAAHAAAARVLLVGSWHGRKGRYRTIQGAVRAAKPSDWILVGPGDYHERADHRAGGRPSADDSGGGVYITTPKIHLRGVDRNKVVVDGTKRGTGRCPKAGSKQDFGPLNASKHTLGRNGVEVYKASGVSVENLTACNFLDGAGGGGNEIWFNGGDGSGKIGMGRFRGAYLSATTTFWKKDAPAGAYGIFSSNSRGPGIFTRSYASNMDDSSFYVGACRPDCNQVVDHVHAQGSTLGLSSTNVGGHLIIQNSEWDLNKTGMVTNSQNNDDAPEPQDGSCPLTGGGAPGPGGTGSCTIWRNNYVHDNNNPHVPASGTAGEGPVGTGMVIAGGRFDTIKRNRVERNGAWGILLIPFPDIGNPPPVAHCRGGVQTMTPDGTTECYFDDWGNEIASNRLKNNGFFGNPTNGDLAEISNPENPGNCWHRNTDPAGVTSEPPAIQTTHGTCGKPNSGDALTSPLGAQVACATGFGASLVAAFPACPNAGTGYPQQNGQVNLIPLPKQKSMPNPCAGVPDNPWCRHGKPRPAARKKKKNHGGAERAA